MRAASILHRGKRLEDSLLEVFCLVLDGCAHVVGIAVARDEAIANEHEGSALDADLVGVVLGLFDLCGRFGIVGISLEA